MTEKPFSQSCENNKQVILQVLQKQFRNNHQTLEIGSGSGQHALYFSQHLPWLQWQTSDREENHPGILAWMASQHSDNLLPPINLDVGIDEHWPEKKYDAVFTANTAHIMGWSEVKQMFAGVSKLLLAGGLFIQYGPFNRDGEFSSDSNRQFEMWLKQQGSQMGIRDIIDLTKLAQSHHMNLKQEVKMPANNLILIWEKSSE